MTSLIHRDLQQLPYLDSYLKHFFKLIKICFDSACVELDAKATLNDGNSSLVNDMGRQPYDQYNLKNIARVVIR